MRNMSKNRIQTSWFGLAVVCIVATGIATYVINGLQTSMKIYDSVSDTISHAEYSGSVREVLIPNTSSSIHIPVWDVFKQDQLWALVSSKHPLTGNNLEENMIDIVLSHGDENDTMKVRNELVKPLNALFEVAQNEGILLSISSGYRSITDQQELYDEIRQIQGENFAKEYVADPGTSEHHTGLAIDFSDRSSECSQNSNECRLSGATAMWLANNAYKYGFVLRYPEGSESITGISFEPWHYRFVGKPLAKKVYESKLTLDEVLMYMRPALSI